MKNTFDKYFADELTPQEIKEFLLEVASNTEWREEFIEDQQLMAYIALLSRETDDEKARQGLSDFMLKMGNK